MFLSIRLSSIHHMYSSPSSYHTRNMTFFFLSSLLLLNARQHGCAWRHRYLLGNERKGNEPITALLICTPSHTHTHTLLSLTAALLLGTHTFTTTCERERATFLIKLLASPSLAVFIFSILLFLSHLMICCATRSFGFLL